MNKLILSVLTGVILQTSAFAIDTEQAGDILQIAIPSVAYGTTLYLGDKEGQHQFYKSFGTNLGVTYGLKFSINKKRPNGGDHSFPSGHTSSAFQGASFIHKRYGLEYAIPAYLLATFVGYSRVECDAHYTSDVVAGAIIGTLSSFYFTTKYKGFDIKPIVMNNKYGLVIQKRW